MELIGIMRRSQYNGSRIYESLGIIIFLLVLFVTGAESWGQCTPGQKAGGYPNGPWVGD